MSGLEPRRVGEMLRGMIGRVLMKGHGPDVLPQDELKELVVLFSAKRRLQTYKRGVKDRYKRGFYSLI